MKATADPNDLIYNTTENEFGNSKTSHLVTLQFDYRNVKMLDMRNTAIYLYYVMIFIIVIQFFMLLFRNVGFLPLWTLIEYM